MSWVEVGKADCEECGGTGVDPFVHDRIQYDGIEYLKKQGYRCSRCRGTGKRSIGYQDLRDASGR